MHLRDEALDRIEWPKTAAAMVGRRHRASSIGYNLRSLLTPDYLNSTNSISVMKRVLG
jgi:hypothetical protein